MPVNVNPDYVHAEREYSEAQTSEEQIRALEKMISFAPAHKGGENLRAQLKTRYKRLKEKLVKSKKSGKTNYVGIKKDDMQLAIIGFTNSGKSSLMNLLTNAKPKISEIKFTTKQSVIGMLGFSGTYIQMIEIPSLGSSYFDKGIPNTADTLVLLVNNLNEIEKIKKELTKTKAKQIIAFNKIDLLTQNEKRKIEATLKSKKYDAVLISTKTKEGIEELKSKIFGSFDILRIHTKEPGKEKSPRPIIMKPESIVKDVAEKILKGFSKKVKETRIWGPSSKFSGQVVGMKHVLKDMDTVEFKTK